MGAIPLSRNCPNKNVINQNIYSKLVPRIPRQYLPWKKKNDLMYPNKYAVIASETANRTHNACIRVKINYICMYIHTYIYIYICIYMYVRVCMYV